MVTFLAIISLTGWIGLVFFWHGFWRTDQRLPDEFEPVAQWPSVVAIVPARNEEETIERCLSAIARQSYAGDLRIVLVNDSSTDRTGDLARELDTEKLTVVDAPPLKEGWAGKMWALKHGVREASENEPDYYWFTDADIEHGRCICCGEPSDRRVVFAKAY